MRKTMLAAIGVAVSLSLAVVTAQPTAAHPRLPASPMSRIDVRSAAVDLQKKVEQRDSRQHLRRSEAVRTLKAAYPRLALSGFGEVAINQATGYLDHSTRIISAPVVGGNLMLGSNVTVFVGPDGNLIDSYEILFVPMDENSGRTVIWRAGTIVFDKVTTNDGSVLDPTDPVNVGFSLSKFNKCLASQGIAAWVVTAITAACSVACAATVGTGCAVCIIALALVAGPTLALCLGRAQQ
nr:hypothetical protein [Propionicimonas sp.]